MPPVPLTTLYLLLQTVSAPPAPNAPPLIGRGLRPGGNVNLDFDIDAPPSQPLMPKIQNIDALLAKVIGLNYLIELENKS